MAVSKTNTRPIVYSPVTPILTNNQENNANSIVNNALNKKPNIHTTINPPVSTASKSEQEQHALDALEYVFGPTAEKNAPIKLENRGMGNFSYSHSRSAQTNNNADSQNKDGTKEQHIPGYTLSESRSITTSGLDSNTCIWVLLFLLIIGFFFYHFLAKNTKVKKIAFFCYMLTLLTIILVLISPYVFDTPLLSIFYRLPFGINNGIASLGFGLLLVVEMVNFLFF